MKKELREPYKKEEVRAGYLFLLPNISGFLLFTFLPVLASLVLAFMKWDIFGTPQWVGLGNFSRLIYDEKFWFYLWNTLFFMLAIPLGMAVSLALALIVNIKLRAVVLYRTVFFLPVVSSLVAVALLWRWLYNPEYGLINTFLRALGMTEAHSFVLDLPFIEPIRIDLPPPLASKHILVQTCHLNHADLEKRWI